MNIVKNIVLNQLIRLRFVRELAKMRHVTGINSNPNVVDQVFREYFAKESPTGKRILELGPGQTYQIMAKAKCDGAASVSILDIEKYLDSDVLDRCGIDYRIYDGGKMPYEDESFDFVCSHTVLEHVRFPDTTVREISRVLRPGGMSVHTIDLRDHFYLEPDNERIFDCLRYSNRIWDAMTWNRSTYVNRLRYSDWMSLFAKSGVQMLDVETIESACIGQLYASAKLDYLTNLTEQDALTTIMLHYGVKNRQG